MLIKVFTNHGTIRIIENVHDVVLQGGQYYFPRDAFALPSHPDNVKGDMRAIPLIPAEWGPDCQKTPDRPCINPAHYVIFDDLRPKQWEDISTPDGVIGGWHDESVRVVDFYDNEGIPKRLLVAGFAYVCNDEGKTIHKVE